MPALPRHWLPSTLLTCLARPFVSLQEQSRILRRFRAGNINLLMSTAGKTCSASSFCDLACCGC